MDLTAEFQNITQRIAAQLGQKPEILNKPRIGNVWIKAGRDLNLKVQDFEKYLKTIKNPYLDIRDLQECNYPFPKPLDVLNMSSSERNDLDLQLIKYANVLQQNVKQLSDSTPRNLISFGEIVTVMITEKIQAVREYHKSMQRKRTEKETFKQQYSLLTRIFQPSLKTPIYADTDSDEEDIPQETKMLLESENASLVEQLEGTLHQVRNATQTMQEIAEMQSTLAIHLTAQSETIQQIHHDTLDANVTIEQGNKYLHSAEKIFGGPRVWVFVFFLVASFVVLFLDYYTS